MQVSGSRQKQGIDSRVQGGQVPLPPVRAAECLADLVCTALQAGAHPGFGLIIYKEWIHDVLEQEVALLRFPSTQLGTRIVLVENKAALLPSTL